MICKKSVEDVVRAKSLTSFVILENRAKDDDDSRSSNQQKLLDKNKTIRKKVPIPRDFGTISSIQRGKSTRAAFSFTFCFVFSYRWVCLSGDRVVVIATITAAARDEKKNGSFATTTIAASSQKTERKECQSVGR